MGNVRFVAVAFLTVFALSRPVAGNAAVISVNLGTNNSDSAAGVVSASHWNSTALGGANLTLKDSSGVVVPGLTITEGATFGACKTDDTMADFPKSADTEMMGSGHYVGVGSAKPGLRVTFSGTVPYQTFDLYVYTHFGKVGAYTQDVFILSGVGGDLGLNKIAKDIDGTAKGYSEASATESGDYVVFRGISRDRVGSKFIVQAGGGAHSGEYGYMNGIQIVDATARSSMIVPQPNAFPLLGAGTVTLLRPIFGASNVITEK